MESLNLIANLNATHTLYAAACISDKRKIAVGFDALNACIVNIFKDIEVVCNFLKLAGSAAHAGCAIAVVLTQNELNVNSSCLTHTGAVCENNHSVLCLCVAGSNKAFIALHLNNADAAGTDFVELFEIAESRNIYVRFFCRIKNR